MSVLCTAETEQILKAARKFAAELRHEYVGTEHLLFAVLSNGPQDLRMALQKYNLTADRVRQVLAFTSEQASKRPIQILPWSPRAREILSDALRLMRGGAKIDSWCLVNALFSTGIEASPSVARIVSTVANRPSDELEPIFAVVREHVLKQYAKA